MNDVQASHPFFKGCTRPAMFARVPLVPWLMVTGAFALLAMWSFVLWSGTVAIALAIAYVPVFFTMRSITKRDDQRLLQWWLRARTRARHANKRTWGAIAYSPLRLTRRP